MDDAQRPSVRIGPDVVRQYSDAEERRLAANLYALLRRIHQGAFQDRPLDIELLQEFHAELFHGVRDHAGRIRSASFGSERLTFGPNRSSPRETVPDELEAAFDNAVPMVRALLDDPADPQFEEKAIQISVWLHARVIQIHPFEDGNGRTSRALLNEILMRLGLPPLYFEAPKEEYRQLLNHYYRSGEIGPLMDFAIGLYADQIGNQT